MMSWREVGPSSDSDPPQPVSERLQMATGDFETPKKRLASGCQALEDARLFLLRHLKLPKDGT